MSLGFLIGVSLITAVGTLVLRQYNRTYAFMLAVAGGISVLVGSLGIFGEIIAFAKELLQYSGVESQWFILLIKALGICYLCQFGADVCRDAGETAMAGYVELAGKIITVALSLPLLSQIIRTIVNLLEL